MTTFARPGWDALRAPALRRCLPWLEAAADVATAPASRWLELPAARAAAAEIRRAAGTGDRERAAAAVAELAGLGEGLTPAGDDYLVGALHALWAVRGEGAREFALEVAGVAAPRTTSLSGAWLEAAARGEAAPAWRHLCEALASGDETAVKRAIENVLSMGHTSGAAALAGFTATLTALLEVS
jgi:hypothetical protein